MINDKLKNEKILDLTLHEIMEIVDNNPERLFTHNGEEFYITSIEESEDEL